MAEVLHSRDMETAVRALAALYPRVLVRHKTVLWKAIRLPRARLADLDARLVFNPPAFDGELHAWNREGGLLIYDRAFRRDENIAAHHAQFLVECPFSIAALEAMTAGTREATVVYRPPNWREHERGVRDLYPDAKLCEAVYRRAQQGALPTPGVRAALGSIEDGRIVSDREMGEATGLTPAQVKRIRNVMLRKRDWKVVNPVVLRYPPDEETLLQAYRFIERECPKVGETHLLVGAALTKAERYWRAALRTLERRGCIGQRDELFFYLLDGLEPDWKKLALQHERAKAAMREIAAFIEATPEFNPQESRKNRSRAPRHPSPRPAVA